MKKTGNLLQKHFDTALESPDGIKKLRELILTLAMQGKLVPQDPTDPPASELLKEIQTEKEKLIAEGKIKKQKALPEIKPEEVPYAVPEGWVWTRLNDSIDVRDGTHDSPKYVMDINSYPLVTSKDFKNGEIDFSATKRISPEDHKKIIQRSLVEKKDILFSMIGGNLGNQVLVNIDAEFSIKNVALLKYYSKEHTFPLYVKKFTEYLALDLQQKAIGGAQPFVSLGFLRNSLFPLPPLAEQKRIVGKIDELMALCDKLEEQRASRGQKCLAVHTSAINRLLTAADKNEFHTSWQFITRHFDPIYSVKENVAELKKAILTLAMQGKLVPQDPNDQPASELLKEIQAEKEKLIAEGKIKKQKALPEIKPEEVPYAVPEGWIWTRLNDAIDVRDGTHDTPKYVDKGYPLITSKNLYTGILSFDDVKFISKDDHLKIMERSYVENGDILFAMIGSIGNPVIIETDKEFSIKNVALFKFYKIQKPNNRFIHLFLKYSQERMKSISSGAVQSFVSLGFLRNYLLPLPPLAEQKRIVTRTDELMTLCDKLESQIDQATQKQTALFNAVLAQV